MMSLYQVQLAGGRHFLHEHPSSALSWKDPIMLQLLSQRRAQTVVSDQCEYGATSANSQGFRVPCKKPTKWATTSSEMVQSLSKRCSKTHEHQHLMGGRAAAAAYYPIGLVTAILRGMRNTADAEDKGDVMPSNLVAAMNVAGSVQDIPCTSISAAISSQDVAKEVEKSTMTVKYADGTVKKVHPSGNLKPQ